LTMIHLSWPRGVRARRWCWMRPTAGTGPLTCWQTLARWCISASVGRERLICCGWVAYRRRGSPRRMSTV
jgi:hypothetical protein